MKKTTKPLSVKGPNYNSFNPTSLTGNFPSRIANQPLSDHKTIDNFNNLVNDKHFDQDLNDRNFDQDLNSVTYPPRDPSFIVEIRAKERSSNFSQQ